MTTAPDKLTRSSLSLVLALTLAAAMLRLPGLFTELWFDEISSLQHVQSLHSPWRVLWSIHTDNKHHLIWLWMWILGAHRQDWLYRLPSFIAGVVVLPVLHQVVRKEAGTLAAIISLTLAGFCYPLIFYSSEARGYSLAVFMAVIAYSLAPIAHRPASHLWAVVFSTVIVMGFLSHLTFIYVYGGLFAWTALDLHRNPRRMPLEYHAPALFALSLIYLFDISRMQYAGGPPTSAVDVLRWMLKMSLGTPLNGPWPWLAGGLVCVVCVLGLATLTRQRDSGRVAFFIVSLIALPAALTLTRRTPYLAVRYYLVCLPFLVMLLSIGLARICRSLPGKIVTAAFIVAVLTNALASTLQLQALGRAHVRDCLLRMGTATATDSITYASERPAMDKSNLDYYADTLSPPRPIIFQSSQAPQWWILDLDTPFAVGPPTIIRMHQIYQRDSVYPSDPISGLTWDLYRRVQQ